MTVGKEIAVILTHMVETTTSDTIAAIEAIRQELGRFQSRQRNAAVILGCAAVDVDLAEALTLAGRDSPWLRRILARDVEKLAQALRNAPSRQGGAINARPAGELLDALSDARWSQGE